MTGPWGRAHYSDFERWGVFLARWRVKASAESQDFKVHTPRKTLWRAPKLAERRASARVRTLDDRSAHISPKSDKKNDSQSAPLELQALPSCFSVCVSQAFRYPKPAPTGLCQLFGLYTT